MARVSLKCERVSVSIVLWVLSALDEVPHRTVDRRKVDVAIYCRVDASDVQSISNQERLPIQGRSADYESVVVCSVGDCCRKVAHWSDVDSRK